MPSACWRRPADAAEGLRLADPRLGPGRGEASRLEAADLRRGQLARAARGADRRARAAEHRDAGIVPRHGGPDVERVDLRAELALRGLSADPLRGDEQGDGARRVRLPHRARRDDPRRGERPDRAARRRRRFRRGAPADDRGRRATSPLRPGGGRDRAQLQDGRDRPDVGRALQGASGRAARRAFPQ